MPIEQGTISYVITQRSYISNLFKSGYIIIDHSKIHNKDKILYTTPKFQFRLLTENSLIKSFKEKFPWHNNAMDIRIGQHYFSWHFSKQSFFASNLIRVLIYIAKKIETQSYGTLAGLYRKEAKHYISNFASLLSNAQHFSQNFLDSILQILAEIIIQFSIRKGILYTEFIPPNIKKKKDKQGTKDVDVVVFYEGMYYGFEVKTPSRTRIWAHRITYENQKDCDTIKRFFSDANKKFEQQHELPFFGILTMFIECAGTSNPHKCKEWLQIIFNVFISELYNYVDAVLFIPHQLYTVMKTMCGEDTSSRNTNLFELEEARFLFKNKNDVQYYLPKFQKLFANSKISFIYELKGELTCINITQTRK